MTGRDRVWWIGFSLLVATLLSGSVFLLAASLAPTAEGFQPESSTVDLGDVSQGVTLPVEFTLNNNSGSTLEISRVATECHCTVANTSSRTVRPSETATVHASLDTHGLRNKVQRQIHVIYRLSTNPTVELAIPLQITATVLPDYYIEGDKLTFSQTNEAVRTITLRSRTEQALTVISAKCTHHSLTVEDIANDASVCHIKVRFNPASWTERKGSHDVPRLIVETSSMGEPECVVPVTIQFLQTNGSTP